MHLSGSRWVAALAVALLTFGVPAWVVLASSNSALSANVPSTLSQTGLYADIREHRIADDVLAFSPQYPLWTDGARKERWIRLPPGTSIDAGDVDAWIFPIGTRIWKEFAFERRAETRSMELGDDGRWSFATYAWNEEQTEAHLAPQRGLRGVCESIDGAQHDLPSVFDCRACHEGHRTAVLGFSALQLSSDRDPLAPHAEKIQTNDVDLRQLVERGWLRNLPNEFLEHAPTIDAHSATARAALGYLHGNCSSCHNSHGALAELGLDLESSLARGSAVERTTLDVLSRFRLADLPNGVRIAPGEPERSVLFRRLSTRNPLVQMPALGTHVVDARAVELLREWILSDLPSTRTVATRGARILQR